jgi:hypothetical protein
LATAVTNDDRAIREDLYGVITRISPTETQLLSGLARTDASAVNHEWPKDTLKTPGVNAQIEGSDAIFAARTNPSRTQNLCQIVKIEFAVSGTEDASNTAGFAKRYAYEMDKAMKEWANDFEFALMRSTVVSTSGSALRSMTSLKASITTNATSQSGVSLSENQLNDYLGNAWERGGTVDEVYVGKTLKRRISGYTAGGTKNVETTDKRLVNRVDVYESDFGIVKLFKHRYITVSGDTHNDIVGIQSDKFRVAMLRDPKHEALAKTGDATKGHIVGEGTLEFLAEDSSFIATRHL